MLIAFSSSFWLFCFDLELQVWFDSWCENILWSVEWDFLSFSLFSWTIGPMPLGPSALWGRLSVGLGSNNMATAEEKRTITKKRLQELRNMCREHYNVLIEEGTMPDAADVRVTNQKLEELMELLDGKIKWDNAWLVVLTTSCSDHFA